MWLLREKLSDFRVKLYACTIACLSFIRLCKQQFYKMLLATVPFIEIGGKQKITMASICDEKDIL